MTVSRRELIGAIASGVALPVVAAAQETSKQISYPGPTTLKHRVINANGLKFHIAEQGSGPLVLLCHGFPESWYSWRHQIPALADAGYRVIAPDMRGYGGTDGPPERDSYSIMDLVGDMVGLVAALGERSAVVIGHDAGATVAWNAALLRPEVFPAVVGMSVPFRQRGPAPPLRLLRQAGLNTYYWIYYQDVGVADAEYDRDPKATVRRTLYTFSGDAPHSDINRRILEPGKGALDNTLEPDHLPPWLGEKDLDYMASELARRGFRNPLNYYRNIDRNWELLAPWAGAMIHQPALFIAGKEDHVIRGPTGQQQLKDLPITVPGIRGVVLVDGAGHYIQQERPKEVNAALLDFLRGTRALNESSG
jgi:pimeloyl-ACP methyl ester carboxylesterase